MALTRNVYALPFGNNRVKAISDPRAHFAHFRHAVDFLLQEGTEILAPKSGKVVDVKTDSKQGGPEPKYNDIKYLNYMTLQHNNGEFSQFCHLKHKGAIVKIGEKVKAGQVIALSGNTGFTTAPHLHFQVFKLNKTKIGWETLRIRFKEKVDVDRTRRPVPQSIRCTMKELERVRKRLDST